MLCYQIDRFSNPISSVPKFEVSTSQKVELTVFKNLHISYWKILLLFCSRAVSYLSNFLFKFYKHIFTLKSIYKTQETEYRIKGDSVILILCTAFCLAVLSSHPLRSYCLPKPGLLLICYASLNVPWGDGVQKARCCTLPRLFS